MARVADCAGAGARAPPREAEGGEVGGAEEGGDRV